MKSYACILILCTCFQLTIGYAKLAETINCANGDCSETVSEGKAKLAYQPRDKKFLNLKKGDVVLVKGKKAGLKTDLWGGQDILGQSEDSEEMSTLSTRDQKIRIQRKLHQEKQGSEKESSVDSGDQSSATTTLENQESGEPAVAAKVAPPTDDGLEILSEPLQSNTPKPDVENSAFQSSKTGDGKDNEDQESLEKDDKAVTVVTSDPSSEPGSKVNAAIDGAVIVTATEEEQEDLNKDTDTKSDEDESSSTTSAEQTQVFTDQQDKEVPNAVSAKESEQLATNQENVEETESPSIKESSMQETRDVGHAIKDETSDTQLSSALPSGNKNDEKLDDKQVDERSDTSPEQGRDGNGKSDIEENAKQDTTSFQSILVGASTTGADEELFSQHSQENMDKPSHDLGDASIPEKKSNIETEPTVTEENSNGLTLNVTSDSPIDENKAAEQTDIPSSLAEEGSIKLTSSEKTGKKYDTPHKDEEKMAAIVDVKDPELNGGESDQIVDKDKDLNLSGPSQKRNDSIQDLKSTEDSAHATDESATNSEAQKVHHEQAASHVTESNSLDAEISKESELESEPNSEEDSSLDFSITARQSTVDKSEVDPSNKNNKQDDDKRSFQDDVKPIEASDKGEPIIENIEADNDITTDARPKQKDDFEIVNSDIVVPATIKTDSLESEHLDKINVNDFKNINKTDETADEVSKEAVDPDADVQEAKDLEEADGKSKDRINVREADETDNSLKKLQENVVNLDVEDQKTKNNKLSESNYEDNINEPEDDDQTDKNPEKEDEATNGAFDIQENIGINNLQKDKLSPTDKMSDDEASGKSDSFDNDLEFRDKKDINSKVNTWKRSDIDDIHRSSDNFPDTAQKVAEFSKRHAEDGKIVNNDLTSDNSEKATGISNEVVRSDGHVAEDIKYFNDARSSIDQMSGDKIDIEKVNEKAAISKQDLQQHLVVEIERSTEASEVVDGNAPPVGNASESLSNYVADASGIELEQNNTTVMETDEDLNLIDEDSEKLSKVDEKLSAGTFEDKKELDKLDEAQQLPSDDINSSGEIKPLKFKTLEKTENLSESKTDDGTESPTSRNKEEELASAAKTNISKETEANFSTNDIKQDISDTSDDANSFADDSTALGEAVETVEKENELDMQKEVTNSKELGNQGDAGTEVKESILDAFNEQRSIRKESEVESNELKEPETVTVDDKVKENFHTDHLNDINQNLKKENFLNEAVAIANTTVAVKLAKETENDGSIELGLQHDFVEKVEIDTENHLSSSADEESMDMKSDHEVIVDIKLDQQNDEKAAEDDQNIISSLPVSDSEQSDHQTVKENIQQDYLELKESEKRDVIKKQQGYNERAANIKVWKKSDGKIFDQSINSLRDDIKLHQQPQESTKEEDSFFKEGLRIVSSIDQNDKRLVQNGDEDEEKVHFLEEEIKDEAGEGIKIAITENGSNFLDEQQNEEKLTRDSSNAMSQSDGKSDKIGSLHEEFKETTLENGDSLSNQSESTSNNAVKSQVDHEGEVVNFPSAKQEKSRKIEVEEQVKEAPSNDEDKLNKIGKIDVRDIGQGISEEYVDTHSTKEIETNTGINNDDARDETVDGEKSILELSNVDQDLSERDYDVVLNENNNPDETNAASMGFEQIGAAFGKFVDAAKKIYSHPVQSDDQDAKNQKSVAQGDPTLLAEKTAEDHSEENTSVTAEEDKVLSQPTKAADANGGDVRNVEKSDTTLNLASIEENDSGKDELFKDADTSSDVFAKPDVRFSESTKDVHGAYNVAKLKNLVLQVNLLKENISQILNKSFDKVATLRNEITSLINEIKVSKSSINASSYNLISKQTRNLKHQFTDLEDDLEDCRSKEDSFSDISIDEISSQDLDLHRTMQVLVAEIKERKDDQVQLLLLSSSLEKMLLKIKEYKRLLVSMREYALYSSEDYADSLFSEVERRTSMDNHALLATEQEAKRMQQKLKSLEDQLNGHNFENKDYIKSLQAEAESLKKRLSSLEMEVLEKKKIEETHTFLNNEKELELQERIESLEAELQRRKDNEAALYAAQNEAAALKEKFANLNHVIERTVSKRNSELLGRFSTLEKELLLRRSNKSATLSQTQAETLLLQEKIKSLEVMLQQNKDASLLSETSELQDLKKQLNAMESDLKSKKPLDEEQNKVSTRQDKAIQVKIDLINDELNEIALREKNTFETQELMQKLMERVATLENRLKETEQSKSGDAINKEELVNVLKEQMKDNEDTIKEMWELMISKQKCPKAENSHDITTSVTDKVHLSDQMQDSDCSVAPKDRVKCGVLMHTPQAMCNALNCCWSSDVIPNIPNCYYSLTKVQANQNAMLEKVEQRKTKDEGEADPEVSTLVPPSDSYDQVHEGKVVSWDESFEEKPVEKSTSWDEEIGEEDGSEPPDVVLEMQKSNDTVDTNESQRERSVNETEQSDKTGSVMDEFTTSISPPYGEDLEVVTPPTVADVPTVTPSADQVTETDDVEAEPPLVDDDSNESMPEQAFDSVLIEDETNNVQSIIVKFVYLVSQIPADFVYVVTPLGLWFVSLLPEEYQSDVYGVSWPIISLTAALGIFFIWVLMWRSGVSKRISREKHFISAAEELRAQLLATMEEKLHTEKEVKSLNAKVKEITYNFEDERTARTKTEENYSHLEEIVRNLQEENQTKVEEIEEYNSTLKGIEKEKNSLLNKTKHFEKQLDERKTTNSNLEKQISIIDDELKESKKSRKELEDKLKDYEKRFNKKEKVEERLEKKLKEFEEQSKKLKEQVGELEHRLSVECDENQGSKQEIDVLKDCLMQLQGVREALTEPGDEDVESEELVEKQKDKLKSLIDVSLMQKKMKQTEIAKGRVIVELEAERKSREKTEALVGELEAERENIKAMQQKAERELQVHQAKLNVMQDFYTKREVEMQGKLGKEVTVRELREEKLAEESDRISLLMEQVEDYKKMNEESKRQFAESEKQRKQEINEYEKKAHSNWLTTREAERKRDEANREVSILRTELEDIQQRLLEAENREPIMLRPRPYGPPGLYRDMSPPVRMGGRRSPTGSLHSEGGPTDRPPRPSSHGHPPSEPLEAGEGPPSRRFAPRRGSKDPPRRDGTSPFIYDPMFDGPPPIRGPFMPPRGGPPPFGPPPFAPDDLPMVYDDGFPMRDLPPMMHERPPFRDGPMFRDGPPPRGGRPPAVRHGAPPMTDQPQSGPPPPMFDAPGQIRSAPRPPPGPDSNANSAYMDRPGPPNQTTSRPPMMPLHGNHPYNNSTNEYDIHSVQGAV